VGEGLTEMLFLNYLKRLYLKRNAGLSLKIKQAQGGDPRVIVEYAERQVKAAAYDSVLVWMDTDRPWPNGIEARVSRNKPPITLIGSSPCVEGFFLSLLKEPVSLSAANKSRFNQIAGVESVVGLDFGRIFPREVLDRAAGDCKALECLIRQITEP